MVRVQELESAGVRENEAKISEMKKRNKKTTNEREGGSGGTDRDGVPRASSARG